MKKRFSLTYVCENKNPYQNNSGDCAIRAISKLLNISWEEAYKMLFRVALKRKAIATDISTIKMTLSEIGCKIVDLNYKPLIDYKPKGGECILILDSGNAGHAIYIKDNSYYDRDIVLANDYKITYEIRKEKE